MHFVVEIVIAFLCALRLCVRFLVLVKFREDVFVESLVFYDFSQTVEEVEFEVGDLLFGDAERGGDLFVGCAADE